MEETGADFTNTFRSLSRLSIPSSDDARCDANADLKELAELKNYLLQQCATVDELKLSYTPKLDPRLFFYVQLYTKVCWRWRVCIRVFD
jgi:serine/tyrosine/threonine adenylyltransferase